MTETPELFDSFRHEITAGDIIPDLRSGLIGEGMMVPGPRGPNPLIYADYVASGRALKQLEDRIAKDVLPYYSNAHTEASYCGRHMNRLRAQARRVVAQACGADTDHAVIFAGAGATAGLTKLAALLGVDAMMAEGKRPLVLIGPYEHHSNILPWRESGAEVIDIAEAAAGGPDMDDLAARLAAHADRSVIGSFSAASNVTGIVSDVAAITRLLKRSGAMSVWDYAGAGPYLPIDMGMGMDAVVVSPHKFIGGPGASGVLILRRDAVKRARPTSPGGGTVRFVSPWGQDYAADVVAREEAGTPNVIGDIRAALCFIVKEAIGEAHMAATLSAHRRKALTAWRNVPGLTILGTVDATALPIFSFMVRDRYGSVVHPQLVCRILSDHFGIQARGGCACAGPYAHRLLGIDRAQSDQLRAEIASGNEVAKPGWTRLAFSVLMDDAKVEFITDAVSCIARDPEVFTEAYAVEASTARFTPNLQLAG
ncbi:MAG: aminotransferase class V-fold PLP-dependent enzyme [Sulfitobacter litoralis]|uniref:aminotransferase class V-fold PLP-dependent enzyme n=1 Tax=Sulfitobacter litoralis TaxID=335975 RepID=UPI00300186C6